MPRQPSRTPQHDDYARKSRENFSAIARLYHNARAEADEEFRQKYGQEFLDGLVDAGDDYKRFTPEQAEYAQRLDALGKSLMDGIRSSTENLKAAYREKYGDDFFYESPLPQRESNEPPPPPGSTGSQPANGLAVRGHATSQHSPRSPGETPLSELADELPRERVAGSPEFMEQLQKQVSKVTEAWRKVPAFISEDLLEGVLVGGGVAIPVMMLPNQDPHEQAAALAGGVTAATLGGAASRYIGAGIGGAIHPGQLKQGSFGSNLGRTLGRKNMADLVDDMAGVGAEPEITGREFGRAIGRAVGDEAFGIGGTILGLHLAQGQDTTPDPEPGPTMGQVLMGTLPGAAIGLAASGLSAGMLDAPGMYRSMLNGEDTNDAFSRFTVFGGQPGPRAAGPRAAGPRAAGPRAAGPTGAG